MAGKRVTLAAVAKETGYTVNTISRALRDCSDIAPATRRHIQDVAGRMGYVRNMAASSLRLGRSNSIAFIAGYVVNPFFGMLFEYVSRAAAAYGWSVIFLSPNEDEPSELDAIQSAYARGVDGVVLMPTQKSDRARVLLEECRLPYVLLMRDFPGHEDDCLLCDEEQAGAQDGQHEQEDNAHLPPGGKGHDKGKYQHERGSDGHADDHHIGHLYVGNVSGHTGHQGRGHEFVDVFKGKGLDAVEHIRPQIPGQTAGGGGTGESGCRPEGQGQNGHQQEDAPVAEDDPDLTPGPHFVYKFCDDKGNDALQCHFNGH